MQAYFGSLTSRFVWGSFLWKSLIRRNLSTASKPVTGSTVNNEEVVKFTVCANEWWEGSKYGPLQSMNSLRVPLVRDGILSISGTTIKKSLPLEGYKVIDVGCGGGLLTEPLARLGAAVTGLDPGQENIEAAAEHASQDKEIKNRIKYVSDTIENFSANSVDKYDALVCSEVIEHVGDVTTFLNACVDLTKEGGSLFFTTINRTNVSYVAAILGAEYVLNIVPRGTHDWNKFIQPEELSGMLQALNCRIVSIEGMFYNPLTGKWSWVPNRSINYALHAVK